MALILSQSELLNLSWATVNKIETESRRVQPSLLRMVLLSNTYHEYTRLALETRLIEDDNSFFLNELQCRNGDDSDSSDDSDEWERDSSSDSESEGKGGEEETQEYEDGPPPYSLSAPPVVTVQVSEYWPGDDDLDTEFAIGNAGTYITPFSCSEIQPSSSYYYADTKGEFSLSPISPYKQLRALLAAQLRQTAKYRGE